MDYSYILNSALPQKEKLLEYGFRDSKNRDVLETKNRAFNGALEESNRALNKNNGALKESRLQKESRRSLKANDHDILICKKTILNGDFYALVTLNILRGQLEVQVFETATDEKYALFDVASACGAFGGEVRGEVQKLMEEIRAKCFVTQDIKQKYVDFLHSRFGAYGDTPWADDGDDDDKIKCAVSNGRVKNLNDASRNRTNATSTVFRCPNNKWFALVMKIKFSSLGFKSDEPVWAVNLKADPDLIPKVTDRKSIFPAYHMNKKYWITVLLTAVTDFDVLCKLTLRSYELVSAKK